MVGGYTGTERGNAQVGKLLRVEAKVGTRVAGEAGYKCTTILNIV